MRRESWGVAAVFTLNGAILGSWVARVPDAASQTGSSPGVLGLALLGIAGGAIVAMPVTGRICARLNTRHVVTTAAATNVLSLPLIALAHTPVQLAGALIVYGATTGATDVAMNTNAMAAVRLAARPLLPVFHGAFSAGGMVGAAVGGLAADRAGMRPHFLAAAAIGLVVVAMAYRWLPTDPPTTHPADAPGTAPRRFDATIAILGAIAFCSALGEGAMSDWSALFMRDVLDTGAGTAAAGFTAFSLAMTISRFAGTAVLGRYGPASTLVGGCSLAAAGALVVVLSPAPAVALVGFFAVGAGLAGGFPIALNAAGAHASGSGPAIGVVTTIGYTGFLAGPPAIGFVAQWTNLRIGLTLVAVAAGVSLVLAIAQRRLLTEADPSQGPPASPSARI
ncbi:MAG: MFS transporter [Mycobacteriales bacterium]